ncbi:MAG: hypothetical protein KDD58_08900 [Bdellovibrionales bacterium]|nr:hypothetical protein [Bdellovibrionales bacterium]
MKKFLMLFLIIFNVIFTHAEDKHPRVAELEDKFKSDAMDYLEARFPGLPFSVSVSIDPLRRSFGSNYNIKGEKLPFYALEEEEIQDEWDDPTVTLYSLSNRVKKIKLTIQVPSGIKDEELADIKTNLSQILRLIPARDDIEVVKREWNVFPKLKWYLAIGLSSIFALLMGLFFISYISVRRVTKSLESIQANTTSGSGMGNMPASMPNIDLDKMTSKSQGPSGDIKFNDPIKIREVLDTRVAELVANKKDILRLENLILFDKFAQENPRAFGSLFLLFPTELKRMLFAYSNGKHWMEALTEPGEMNMKCLEIMEELGHVKTTDFREFWEKLLIQVWRLDSDFNAVSFLKIIDMQSSLTILAGMPKFISLRLGREVFPGNWATLLDSTYKFKKLSEKECEELYKQSLEMKPLAKLEDLDVFKKDRELIKFLKTADIRTEKEVYSAVPKDSMLHMLRPPFYVVFEQEDVVLKKLVQQYSIMEWAVALFNVPRDQRFKIENLFDEKEKIFYLEMLKGLDKNRPDPNKQGELRSRIANDVTMVVQNLIDYEVGAIVDAQGTDDEAA